ncbi:hypothetical protein ABT324_00615 [Saccharopolyspora sp. NPDC000359]|uniref:hypothetical protein n=1 Tax=Saccharopolyspora sp. NPDC000359 TaxID=3154251 RepID=UPI00333112FA
MLEAFQNGDGGPLFRKTSCGVSYSHEVPDWNGHYGIRELCDICPAKQLALCAGAHKIPTEEVIRSTVAHLPNTRDFDVVEITERAAILAGLEEPARLFAQNTLGFQMHDEKRPHKYRRHGRADIGWDENDD